MSTTRGRSHLALLEDLRWRYACKRFDPARAISPEVWSALEQALMLSPSSYGLQPYRFIVINDRALRERLKPAAHNQAQILDASHLVVFAAHTDMTVERIDQFLQLTASVRKITVDRLAAYRTNILGDLVQGPRHAIIRDWCKRQTYLALGMLLASAASLGVDACPMEGFKPPEVDELLGLPQQGLASTVLCTLGYRLPDDPAGSLPRVRFPESDLIERR